MARRNANLAGLAALGALGYKLATAGKGRGTTTTGDSSRSAEPDAMAEMGDDQYNPDVKQYMDDTINEDVKQRKPAGRKPSAPSSPAMMSKEEEASIRAKGGPRGTRYLPKGESDTSVYKPRRSPDQIGEPRQVMGRQPAKTMSYEDKLAAIPTDEGKYAPVSGSKVDSTELGRNVNAMLMGRGPTGLTQLGALGAEAATAGRAQRAYNAAQAERRAAEGFSPAEAMRRKELIDEAAMAGGMKRGGKVKKMASGGMAKAEKPAAKGWGKARGARGAKYY